MPRILIVDDHSLIREGLKQVLRDEPEMEVVAEAADGQNVMEVVRQEKADVVLLDISLPGRNGLEILKDVRHEYPKLPVLMLSMHPEERFALRALKAGASGYVTKESAPANLIQAIRKVMTGGKYISQTLAEQVAESLDGGSDRPAHQTLSDREYQVMIMIASGKSARVIAQELTLSTRTINTFRARILKKLKVKSSVELTHYAIKNRLIEEM